MFDPFSYDGPKSADRLEDERYVRALMLCETQSFPVVASLLGFHHEALKSAISRINEACDLADAGLPCPQRGRPKLNGISR
jgi:hypothetical protein